VLQNTYYGAILDNVIAFFSTPLIEGMISGLTIGLKACVMIFIFI
jgi:hypothetical protein